jgi:Bacteriophage Mu, Gp36
MSYSSLSDFYRLGLRAEACVPQARTVVTVDTVGDSLLLPVHGQSAGDAFRLVAQGIGGALPAPLSPTALYYAIPLSSDLLQVASSRANAIAVPPVPIDITGQPTGVLGLIVDVAAIIQAHLDKAFAKINGALKAYGTPLAQPYPDEVIETECALAAGTFAARTGILTPAQPTQDSDLITKRYSAALDTLARWRAGEDLPIDVDDATPNVTENGADGWSDTPRDWANRGLIQ